MSRPRIEIDLFQIYGDQKILSEFRERDERNTFRYKYECKCVKCGLRRTFTASQLVDEDKNKCRCSAPHRREIVKETVVFTPVAVVLEVPLPVIVQDKEIYIRCKKDNQCLLFALRNKNDNWRLCADIAWLTYMLSNSNDSDFELVYGKDLNDVGIKIGVDIGAANIFEVQSEPIRTRLMRPIK